MIVDTSGVIAALDRGEPHHGDCRRLLEEADQPLLMSPFVLAEIDYLVSKKAGPEAALRVLEDVAAGAYVLVPFSEGDMGAVVDVVKRYPDMNLGLADASIVAIAEATGRLEVFTLDERHFRPLRRADGSPFTLLPADRH